MNRGRFFKFVFLAWSFAWFGPTACALAPGISPTAAISFKASPHPTQESDANPPYENATDSVLVAYVQDGNLHVWDSQTFQTETIFSSGDVTAVAVSDDGQVIAFLRSTLVGGLDGYLQSALWAIDRNLGNPRELVPAEIIRQRFDPREGESALVAQLAWIPGTHRLLYNGWEYQHRGEGESHATPRGLYLVDADTLQETELVPIGDGLRFVPSPDGSRIALLFLDRFGFITPDAGVVPTEVLTFPAWKSTAPIFPGGAWTLDGRAFVLAAPIEAAEEHVWNFALWRVPLDGVPPQPLAMVTEPIYPESITLTPGGDLAAYYSNVMSGEPGANRWFIVPLSGETGPLATSPTYRSLWATLNWSPSGAAYAIHEDGMVQLCPGSISLTDFCGEPVDLGGPVAALRWLDDDRYLFLTGESSTLFLGSLSGTHIPIVSAPLESHYGPQRYDAVLLKPPG